MEKQVKVEAKGQLLVKVEGSQTRMLIPVTVAHMTTPTRNVFKTSLPWKADYELDAEKDQLLGMDGQSFRFDRLRNELYAKRDAARKAARKRTKR